jgi:ech hydrogenase subunit F
MALGTFSLTALTSLFRKPATTAFPAAPYQPIPGTRGQLRIDLGACNFCTLCALRCPTGAIAVDRQAKEWTLDRFKCIICAACVDACAKQALNNDPHYASPVIENILVRRALADEAEACATPHDHEEGAGA